MKNGVGDGQARIPMPKGCELAHQMAASLISAYEGQAKTASRAQSKRPMATRTQQIKYARPQGASLRRKYAGSRHCGGMPKGRYNALPEDTRSNQNTAV